MFRILFILVLSTGSQLSSAQLTPSQRFRYGSDLSPSKISSYGACLIEENIHVFLTAGLHLKSDDGTNWSVYTAFKALDSPQIGGADVISCTDTPMFFSRDHGLFKYNNGQWEKIGESKPEVNYFFESPDRRIFAADLNSRKIYEGSQDGWANKDFKEIERKTVYWGDRVSWCSNEKKEFYLNLENKPPRLLLSVSNEYVVKFYDFGNSLVYLEYKRGEFNNLRFGLVDQNTGNIVKLNALYESTLEGQGLGECINTSSQLNICRYKDGLLILGLVKNTMSIIPLLPSKESNKKETFVLGLKSIISEKSHIVEDKDTGSYLGGEIKIYDYDDILKYIRSRIYELQGQ